ncbi:MAG: flavin reductase family protein [Paenalcaligenes sp.]
MPSTTSFNQKELREAFSHFPSGVAAIAALHEGQRHVIVASSFSVGVSLDPPLAAFFVQRGSSTWPLLAQAQRIGVSVLNAEHTSICKQLASADKAARFEGIDEHVTSQGAIRIPDAPVWFDCSVHDVHPAGDHLAVQLRIHDLHIQQQSAPLVFHQSRFTSLSSCTA